MMEMLRLTSELEASLETTALPLLMMMLTTTLPLLMMLLTTLLLPLLVGPREPLIQSPVLRRVWLGCPRGRHMVHVLSVCEPCGITCQRMC